MELQDYIDKIVKYNEWERKERQRTTELKVRHKLVLYSDSVFDVSDGYNRFYGYTKFIDGEYKRIESTDGWVTYIFDTKTEEDSILYYTGYITDSIAFEVILTDGSVQYINVNGSNDNPVINLAIQLPANVDYIRASYKYNTDYELQLRLEKYQYVDITLFLRNGDNLLFREVRDGLSGVELDVSTSIEFIQYGKNLIDELYRKDELRARARLDIYRRKRDKNEYNLVKKVMLNFQKYDSDDIVTSIEAIDESLADVIKSGQSTKFDIPVSAIADPIKFNPQRINLTSFANYEVPMVKINGVGKGPISPDVHLFGVSFSGLETSPDAPQHIGNSQFPYSYYINEIPDDAFFFEAKSSSVFNLNIKFKIRVSDASWEPIVFVSSNLKTNRLDFEAIPIKTTDLMQIDISTRFLLNEGDKLTLWMEAPFFTEDKFYEIQDFEVFNLNWRTTPKEVTLDVIDPEVLLQEYIDRISGYKNRYKGRIEWEENNLLKLCAAESVRAFPDAILHSSLKDLIEWLRVIGYERQYIGDEIVFRPRDQYFEPDNIALELNSEEVANRKLSANEDFAYTSVSVGYKKHDYESTNGRFEVNGTFDYLCDYQNANTNILELVSPFRGDSLGLELLIWENNKKTTDTNSDNDLFCVQLSYDKSNNRYIYSEENMMTVENVKMYNGSLNPYFLVKRNESLIGINTNSLKFTGTTNNRNATLSSGLSIYSDVIIEKRLFKPSKYTFNTGNNKDLPFEDKWGGLIRFNYKGVWNEGYIKQIDKTYVNDQESEWILYVFK